jgi:ABC-2 type transport system ATP-binding protein
VLEVSGLGKDYGDIMAVGELCFSVSAGEVFGLLGPNGAGKTTAISMIAGLQPATRGHATVGGHSASDPKARRLLGLVPQEIAVYLELTARENLAFFASLYGLHGKAVDDAILWALRVAGLEERGDEPVKRFSGGMKRRLNIAAALVHHPKLIMLDEPTVGVDPQSRHYIFEAIRSLTADGVAVLYTSHYMEEVETLCDRVAIMDNGEILAMDTVSTLVANHGEAILSLHFHGDVAAVREVVDDSFTVEDSALRGPMPDSLADLLNAVEQTGASIESCQTREANLEGVFLALTGHSLRDE